MGNSNTGLGVLIQSLGGNRGSSLIVESIGKTIASARLNKDADRLELRFVDGTGIYLKDEGQSCCENRYMSCDDDLADFTGATLSSVELRDAPSVDTQYDSHDVEFLAVITSNGEFTCANHNEHNGYYGGFWIKAGKLEEVPT